LAAIAPLLSPVPAGAGVDAGVGAAVGEAGELLPPPEQPLIQTVIPTKSALTDAALNSRRVRDVAVVSRAIA
jgi:hypothetical protein